jgi:hypothetical protein
MRYLFLSLLALALVGCDQRGCIIDMDPSGLVALRISDGSIKQFEVGGFEVRQFKIGDDVTLRACSHTYPNRCTGGILGNGRCQGGVE